MAELKKILSYPANDIDKILQQGIYSVADNTERDALATTIKTIDRTIYVRSTKKMFVWENNAWRDITPGGEVLVGTSAPTTETAGDLGQFYLDTANNSTYQCVAVDTSTPSYAWVELLRDSNLKTINGNSVVGSGDIKINTYQNFPASWTTDSTTAALMADIANDTSAVPGMAYLGEVTCSDLPFNGNAELIISIIKGVGSNKVIVAQLTSGNVRPYYWQYTYWNGSGTGWKSFISSESVDSVPTQGSTNVITSGGVYEALQGKVEPLSFANYSIMVTAINSAASNVYNIGQDVLIVQTGVPDLWFSGREVSSVPYTYTTDEALINELTTSGYVQIGYYKLSYLEDELQTVMTIHRLDTPVV